jgi:hypothetical protein
VPEMLPAVVCARPRNGMSRSSNRRVGSAMRNAMACPKWKSMDPYIKAGTEERGVDEERMCEISCRSMN